MAKLKCIEHGRRVLVVDVDGGGRVLHRTGDKTPCAWPVVTDGLIYSGRNENGGWVLDPRTFGPNRKRKMEA